MHGIATRSNNMLSVPDKMLTELALGTDEPVNIANRYGFDDVDFASLEAQPSYQKALTARVQELESKGEIFRVKARYLADDLLEDIYNDAKDTRDPKVRLDAIKFLSAAAGVDKPPQGANVGAGRKVTISIGLGAGQTASVTMDFESFDLRPNSDLDYEGECEVLE